MGARVEFAFFLALVGAILTACATAPLVKTLADGRAGTIHFESLNMTPRDFLRGDGVGTPVVISGDLRLPNDAAGRIPAMVIVHGSDGITAGEVGWANDLVKIGVAAFLLDSFSGRGVRETFSDQSRINNLVMILDAYRTLELLATHPRIDPTRIGVMGLSKGGWVTLYASLRRFQRMHGPRGLEFAVYLPFYPGCTNRFIGDNNVSDRPIRIFNGEADDQSLFTKCSELAGRLRRAGKDIEIVGYPSAYHAFDNPAAGPPRTHPDRQNFGRCSFDEAKPPADMNAYISSCRSQGVTIGYDFAARADAVRKVQAVLGTVFRLDR